MSTVIRPALKANNKYYISKERYYELKHFAMQYHAWLKEYNQLESFNQQRDSEIKGSSISDETSRVAIRKAQLSKWMKMIEDTAKQADEEIGSYIFQAVTNDFSFNTMVGVYGIPCGKDMYYDRYRKFYWLLDKVRD